MIKVAITGNIASGKTQVEKYISKKYPVIDTDKIAHALLEKCQDEIIKLFMDFDITENNKISRKKLGEIVFRNSKLKRILENFLHPKIKEEILKFFIENSNAKLTFVSIPLLFEAKFESIFDKIIFIYADDSLRLKRLMSRNSLTKQEAILRLNSQMPQIEKLSKSDYIIRNENTLETLYKNIDNILSNF